MVVAEIFDGEERARIERIARRLLFSAGSTQQDVLRIIGPAREKGSE